MENNPGSSSVWKSLAVAFGDGLAFGVAVTLAQNRARGRVGLPAAEPPAGGAGLPAAPGMDAFLLEKTVAAVEARLAEQAAQIGRRLAETELRLGREIQSERARDEEADGALRQALSALEQRLDALESGARRDREQTAALQQRLAAFEHDLPEQLGARLEAGVRSLESRLANESHAMAGQLSREIRTAFESRLNEIAAQAVPDLAGVDAQIADLTQALQQFEARTALEFASRGEATGRETENRLRGLEETLREEWQHGREADGAAAAGALAALRQQVAALEMGLDARIGSTHEQYAAIEAQLRGHAEAIAQLRQKLAQADQGTLRTMVEIARIAQARLDQMAEPAAPPAPEPPPAEGSCAEPEGPRFASADASGKWRFPVMSGLFLAAMSLAWLRF